MTSTSLALTHISLQRTIHICLHDEEPDHPKYIPSPFFDKDNHAPCASTSTVSHRISTKQSPHVKAFYRHYTLRLTLDAGAWTSVIKSFVAH